MEKFNFVNSKYKIQFFFQSKYYESFGYDFFDFNGNRIEISDNYEDFIVTCTNRGLLLRVYNEYYSDIFNLDDIYNFNDIKTYDYLLSLRMCNCFKFLQFTNSGFQTYIKGEAYLEVSEEQYKEFFNGHKVVIAGFYGSNDEGYFFSPLKNYDEFNPKTWTKLRSHHDVKLIKHVP
jgi:hypothetical protein